MFNNHKSLKHVELIKSDLIVARIAQIRFIFESENSLYWPNSVQNIAKNGKNSLLKQK